MWSLPDPSLILTCFFHENIIKEGVGECREDAVKDELVLPFMVVSFTGFSAAEEQGPGFFFFFFNVSLFNLCLNWCIR